MKFYKSKTSEINKFMMLGAVFMASTPLFLPYIIGGHDTIYQLNRILGIEQSLKNGMFPVRLNAYTFNGYGYADPVFYPPLFMYIPALLHMMGLSFVRAVNVFLILVNAATACIMYRCSKAMFRSEEIGCMSSVIYTLGIYRLCNLYPRAAYGELLAMVFFPLVLYGFYELLFNDQSRWIYLTLGITGVLQSHIISILLVATLCIGAGICCIRRVAEPKRFWACAKTIVSSILLNLWFIVPLIQYMGTEIDTGSLQRKAEDATVPLAKLVELFSKSSGISPNTYGDLTNVMPICLGITLLCGITVFIIKYLIEKNDCERRIFTLFWVGIGLVLFATRIFPWRVLVKFSWFRLFASYIQFPWRTLGLSLCFLAIVSAYTFYQFYKSHDKKRLCMILFAVAVLSSQYMIEDFSRNPALVRRETEVNSVIGQNEYLYPGIDREALDNRLATSDPFISVFEADKKGLSITCSYSMQQMKQGAYIDIPLFYYPGYRAEDEHGEELEISKSETNLVRVFLQDKSGSFLVFFKEPASWRMSECISILAATWLAWELLLVRKRNYRSKSADEYEH